MLFNAENMQPLKTISILLMADNSRVLFLPEIYSKNSLNFKKHYYINKSNKNNGMTT